ncbi:MAG TPA: plastocyanin/azurin family copper-binding protein [Thermoanaerobaculia bacterium]
MRGAALVLLVLALAGCQRENKANPAPAPAGDNRGKLNPILPPQKDAPSGRAVGVASAQIRIELDEYEIRMPAALAAGHHSFLVVNGGKENHSLAIEGNGMHMSLPEALTRGDSDQLDVDLKPGTYTFYCPVPGHRGRGMSRAVTVR